MKTYRDCWIASAKALFAQALAGEPRLLETDANSSQAAGLAYAAEISGDVSGAFTVILDPEIAKTPLLGEGVDQTVAWAEFLREVAEAAAGELLAVSGQRCRVLGCSLAAPEGEPTHGFQLVSAQHVWSVQIRDDLRGPADSSHAATASDERDAKSPAQQSNPGLGLLLDVELEAALRFGCCEMPLGEILELGPGDVVELDRLVTDPVDLIISDKIVARGEVVLINGNFGLRVTEVSTPRNRLESIRCLF
ncbi:MAG TPA: flagellar motor switch protein FliN [Terracidiphilus sp.]|jgi:flagellar motor switch protein FliN/FliY